jgi:hypothetical protein
MLFKKTRKPLKKKALIRARMKKIALIMTAIRAQRQAASRQKGNDLSRKQLKKLSLKGGWTPDKGNNILRKIKKIQGRIAAARLRALDRWKSVKK